jgi:AbrB family looped-hinge helix DNA binding protein
MQDIKFYTVVTSKGTTTIPNRVRRELGIHPGDVVEFNKDPKSGKYSIEKIPSLEEIRKRNAVYIKKHKPLTDKKIDEIVRQQIAKHYKERNG